MKSDDVKTMADLVEFIATLAEAIRLGDCNLQNSTVCGFLEALSGSLADSPGCYLNRDENPDEINPFRVFADSLDAARIYD